MPGHTSWDSDDYGSCRWMSLISIALKTFERALCKMIVNHLEVTKLVTVEQDGFWQNVPF